MIYLDFKGNIYNPFIKNAFSPVNKQICCNATFPLSRFAVRLKSRSYTKEIVVIASNLT